MEPVRLQKFLARAGVASRRASEELIASGRVSVNGEVVREMGTKIDPACAVVELDGARVTLPEEQVVLMLNKPAGYLSAMSDAHDGRLRGCSRSADSIRTPPGFCSLPTMGSWETRSFIRAIMCRRPTALW